MPRRRRWRRKGRVSSPLAVSKTASPTTSKDESKGIVIDEDISIQKSLRTECRMYTHPLVTSEGVALPQFFISSDLFPNIRPERYDLYVVQIGLEKEEQVLVFNPNTPTDKSWVPSGSRIMGHQADARLSIRSDIAARFLNGIEKKMISGHRKVVVSLIEAGNVGLDFVEISTREAGPGEFWGLYQTLQGRCLYYGQWVTLMSLRIQINGLLTNDRYIFGGTVRPKTKLICRSCSCELVWLVQVSREMFDFAADGDLYWEKMINTFMREIFVKWSTLRVQHSLTVIVFARGVSSAAKSRQVTAHRDYYEAIVCDASSRNDAWEKEILPSIRLGFHRFHARLVKLWENGKVELASARDGNLIEAINMTLSRFEQSSNDRAVELAGQSIVIFSASSGAFWTESDLLSITELRMKRSGIGCDLVCMAEPPLHGVPLFVLREQQKRNASSFSFSSSSHARSSFDGKSRNYDIPHWAHISFFSSYAASSAKSSESYYHIVGARGVYSSKTDAFVPLSEGSNFNVKRYRVSMANASDDRLAALETMVRLRLTHKFQIALKNGEDGAILPSDIAKQSASRGEQVEYLLHSGRTVHQLLYDPLDEIINVREYTLKRSREKNRAAALKIAYDYDLFVPYRNRWVKRRTIFSRQESLRWGALDQLIGGEWDPLEYEMSDEANGLRRLIFVVFSDGCDIEGEEKGKDGGREVDHEEEANEDDGDEGDDVEGNALARFETAILHHGPPVVCLFASEDTSRTIFKVPLLGTKRSGGVSSSSRSDRSVHPEWIFLETQSYSNEARCRVSTTLRLRWLVASRARLGVFIENMQREAKKYGLHILQVPQSGSRNANVSKCSPFLPYAALRWPPNVSYSSDRPSSLSVLAKIRFVRAIVSKFDLVEIGCVDTLSSGIATRHGVSSSSLEGRSVHSDFVASDGSFVLKFQEDMIYWIPRSSKQEEAEAIRRTYIQIRTFFNLYSGAQDILTGVLEGALRSVFGRKSP
eukprot:g692.t1